MVNLVAAQRSLLHSLMKMAGIVPHTIEIDAGTVMNMWERPPTSSTKPVVVLVHGFAAEGIVTWQFQVGSLAKNYAVYVPDLLFFGGSTTASRNRSPNFQAECLAKGLRKLGVERCTVVVSGSILAMTDSINSAMLGELGFSSLSELLLPTSVEGCKALFRVATHKKLWFPNRLYRDFLEVMFNNRKERAELLEGLVVRTKDTTTTTIPNFTQRIHLLWGENDQKLEHAQKMNRQLGEKATFQGIKKAAHLVQLERPCVYNRCLKEFLASLHADMKATKTTVFLVS